MLSVWGKKKNKKKRYFYIKLENLCISINIIFMEIDITVMGLKQMEKIFLVLCVISTAASK